MTEKLEKKVSKEEHGVKLFKRLTAIPYLLVLLALLMPLGTVSCGDEQVIAEPTVYAFATGLDLKQELKEPALGFLTKMETQNSAAMEHYKKIPMMENFPKLNEIPFVYGILLAIVLAAVFAFFTPLGSLTLGMLSMVSLWSLVAQLSEVCGMMNMPMIKVGPGAGVYCASVLILIGTAMNIASIVRPIVEEVKAKRKAKKEKAAEN